MRIIRDGTAWANDRRDANAEIVVGVTREELAALCGGLNEALEAVEDWEFQTRVSISPESARALAREISRFLSETYFQE